MSKPLVALPLLVAAVLALSADAFALPRDIPSESRLVYRWNLIGAPAGYGYPGGCGRGDRMIVNRDARLARVLVTRGARWSVTDCDAASDDCGAIVTGARGAYDVYVRVQGQPAVLASLRGDTWQDWLSGETLCLVGTIDLSRGRSELELAPASLFAGGLYGTLWSFDRNPALRICQVRVYERPY